MLLWTAVTAFSYFLFLLNVKHLQLYKLQQTNTNWVHLACYSVGDNKKKNGKRSLFFIFLKFSLVNLNLDKNNLRKSNKTYFKKSSFKILESLESLFTNVSVLRIIIYIINKTPVEMKLLSYVQNWYSNVYFLS